PVDVVHATGGVMPPAPSGTLIATMNDLVFLDQPEHLNARGVRLMTRGFEIARDEAAIVLVPSEATADACRRNGIDEGRLRVVPLGADPVPIDDHLRSEVRARLDLPERFALFVGTVEPRKNLGRLLAAHAAATPDLPLLVVGPDGWGDSGLAPAPGVHRVGRVPAPDLAALYDLAAALVYPSLLEGFGLPVLEAMVQGTAAVTSAHTSTAEVAADTGVLVDPLDIDAIAAALMSVRDEPARWEALGAAARVRGASFSWAETGRRVAAVYDEVAA
ncbi:MAG: glycosyltransferase family 1 protein, partial [Actinomycetota bacterium]